MITIENISVASDGSGRCKYLLKVNLLEVCVFYHNPEDGISECLKRASEAASKVKQKFYLKES
jgi:hypothetical protein